MLRHTLRAEVTGIALASGQRSNNMDAALRYAADYHASIMSRCWIMLSQLTWTISTLILASIIALTVLALFQPLIVLIDSVMFW